MGETRKLNDRYRLLNPLGAGAVRLAFDEARHRDVAVRELRVPPELREAALFEARRATGLRHPSVVRVLDVLIEDGVPWLVMEFVSGVSLEQAVRSRGPLPVQQAARAGVCVLAALTAAHGAGVVHGRVDPGNVLLTATGRAVLAGFGFPSLSMLPSADLWSLAATLHFAVEGRPPGQVPAAGADPLRSLIRAMLHPAGPPPVEVVRETLDRLAVDRPLDAVVGASGPLPPARVAAIGLAVLDRLVAGGAFHGGVQPGNVLIDGAGQARLMPLLRAGTLPAYTAPEGAATQAADLWSLGATLFTAVEGAPPAPGAPLTRAGALAPVLLRLLSGDPAHRPTMDELRGELLAVMAGDPNGN
ncbi:protein kinase domain-containing protein [Nonomuraea gerenzanensis]|uniref:non-specific serine/threonine protein kinase n=1 Tax=Nonomuraea gerenzanensis TaxID=93944 RepID=A0A1M4E167_9ACTN|nr:protein kinase [Nonomuraea gerenzanensis]UBU14842.1 protein kinase [Nonomuraea gerenzanensis]SBO92573.1 serine/threonine protein kinase [Nonomuraea gerenzanensis]